ncbi:MAG: hypothetical protein EBR49_12530, partial [Betaproteobacteria bacterium]|nr:hypothetical protein [Betaproteobacteria bacterium]
QDLYALIQRAVGGEKITPQYAAGAEDDMQARYEARMRLEQEAAEEANNAPQMTEAEFYGMEQEAFDKLMLLSDDQLFTLDDEIPWDAPSNASTEDFLRAMGAPEGEIKDAIAKEQAAAQKDAGRSPSPQEATTGAPQGTDGKGNGGTGTAEQPQPGNAEGLTAPTREEVIAKQEREEQARKNAAAKRRSDEEQAAKEEERKRIAKASEAAADTFELGGDAMQNLTGQQDIFGAGEEKPAEPSPLVKAMNDLMEVRQRIADQGQVVDDRLVSRERQLVALVKELEQEAPKAPADKAPAATESVADEKHADAVKRAAAVFQQYRPDDVQATNPERYHRVTEDDNPKGLKIGDVVEVRGREKLDKPGEFWKSSISVVVSVEGNAPPAYEGGYMVKTLGGWTGIDLVDKTDKPMPPGTISEQLAESLAANKPADKPAKKRATKATKAPKATEEKAALTEREKAAKAKMFNALGKLAALAGKNTRMNWTQEEEQQLLPIVIELFDGAMELGAVSFQQAVVYVRDFISTNLDAETADSIPFDTLQGAYISVAGRHKDKAVTPKKEVVSFDSLEELGTPEQAEAPAEEVASFSSAENLRAENVEAIRASGAEAFAKGEKRIPPDFLSGESKKLWLDGWDSANVAAPIEQAAPDLTQSLVTAIQANKMPKDNPALKKMVEQFDGQPSTPARMKEAQEALEAAIVRVSRDLVAKKEGTRSTYDMLLRLYESQPNLNIRTSTSVMNQAYSTPAPLAYLGSVLADVTSKTSLYEPSAGNGMLTIAADPAKVTVNELEPNRIASLKAQGFKQVLEGDALKADVAPKSQDRVITNPPFGSIKDDKGNTIKVPVDGYKLGQIDHLIAARALETMKDDGKATLIIGANKIAGGLNTDDRIFFNWLYGNYNVSSHFEIDGDLYQRQGAGWPVRVITINGRAKSDRVSPVAGTIQRAQNWEQVYEYFANSLDSSRTNIDQAASARAGGTGARETGAGPLSEPAGNTPAATGGRRQEGSAASAGNVPGASPRNVSDRAQQPADQLGRADPEQRLNAESVKSNRLDPAGDRTVKEPPKSAGSAGTAALASEENQFQVSYEPRSSRKDGGVLIPVNMKQPTQDALSRLEDAVGNIDEYAAKELGYKSVAELHDALMGLQVDSVASAIYQIGQGKGVIIADQTGIGKGRQAASIIRWAERSGHIPVFVSVKPSLFTDMYGDLHDIGSDNINPFILNKDEHIKGPGDTKLFANKPAGHKQTMERVKESGELPKGTNAIFMTYSQVNTENTQRQMLTALADRAVFILDESHNAGGQSNTGEFVTSLLGAAKGVVYLSATYAKRPDNMPLYFKTDIGQAAADNEGLMQAMANGGLPLQTVVSNNLVAAGQMFRRERSYDGVSIETIVDTKHREEHEELSDKTTQALRAIVEADAMFHEVFVKQMDKDLKERGGATIDNAGNQAQAGVDHTQFSSVVHNFVKQMLLGLKAQRAADDAIAALKRDEKPIIAVENTMGSFLEAYARDNMVSQGGDLGSFDYRTVLSRALARTRFVNEVLPNGDKKKREIQLSQLDSLTRAAYDNAQEVIDSLELQIPVSPIDWIRNEIRKAGFTVAEITGRNLAVDYSEKGKATLGAIDTLEQTDKVRTTQLFNSGRLDALILNVAGSTGISLHASEKFADQRQRHMIVAQAAGDINIFMQMLGRVHRTGQVVLPKYSILSVDLPTEKRPTAVLSGKMKSLNANTSSNTDSATSIKTVDMFNKYGDKVVADYLNDNYELARALSVEDLIGGDDAADDLARKATGRLALQPIAVQNSFYEEVESQYAAMMEYLNKTNQNDLEPRTFDFDAQETRAEILFEGENKDSPFGEDAIYGEYSIKAQGKAMTPAEIREVIAQNLGGKNADMHMRELLAPLVKQFDAYIAKLEGTARDNANAARATSQAFMVNHSIGDTFRVDINGDMFNAVVTNIRNTHKASGNPFSMSKVQVTLALNGALRSITVPASQFQRIEVSAIGRGYSIEQLFKEQPANQRETAKIVTGNLLAAYGELQGVRGTIITFSKQDGTTEQGILLPKTFDYKNNTRGDYRLPSAADALRFLQLSDNRDIGRFGIQSRDGVVRVLPAGQGVSVLVPKSKLKGGKYFLDKGLIEALGDFVTAGANMKATTYDQKEAVKALDLLMKKNALYALPSMAEEAKSLTKPAGDAPVFSRSKADPITRVRSAADYYGTYGAQGIARGIKQGKDSAIKTAAAEMARLIPKGATLVPIPSSGGKATHTLKLAEELARLTGAKVANVLQGDARESLYALKKAGGDPDSVNFNYRLTGEIPENAVLIDGVFDTGATMRAALQVLPDAEMAVYAQAQGNDEQSTVLKKDGSFDKWPLFNQWTRAEYNDVTSLLPDEYRNDPHRREPLPAAVRKLRAAAFDADAKGKGYSYTIDDLGNVIVNGADANTLAGIAVLTEKHGLGLFATNVQIASMPALRKIGFVPEQGIGIVLQRAAGAKDVPMPKNQGDSAYRTAPGTMMSLQPRGFPAPMFSLAAKSSRTFSREAQLQANEYVENAVMAMTAKWENSPEIVVAFDMDDPIIPENVRAEDQRQRSAGAYGVPNGFFYKGKVYLMASQLKTDGKIAEVLFHESLGHYGLRGNYGKRLDGILKQVAAMRPADMKAKAEEYGLNLRNERDRMIAAEEVLAEMAQTAPTLGFVKRAIAAIRQFLRDIGLKLELTDNDIIANYLLPARGWVERGGSGKASGGARMSKAETDVSPLGLYSALGRVVAGMDMKAGAPAAWQAALKGALNKGAIKADELEWSGLGDWLKLQTGKVTKEQVQGYLKANGVRVEETQYLDDPVATGEQAMRDELEAMPIHQLEVRAESLDVDLEEIEGDREAIIEAILESYHDDYSEDLPEARFKQYTLPGGTNYREVLLTLPISEPAKADQSSLEAANAFKREMRAKYGDNWFMRATPEERRRNDELSDASVEAYREARDTTYKSSHWVEPNVLAHIRLKDRTDADGKSVLFVEEIQSDWAQEGKKKGFKGVFPNEVLQAAIKGGMSEDQARADIKALLKNPFGTDARPTGDIWRRLIDATEGTGIDLNEVFHDRQDAGLPLAPFVSKTDAWVALAIKRVITMAAQGGYDRVAFVNGDQSAERYDLSKQVQQLAYQKNQDGTYKLSAQTGNEGSQMIGEAVPAEKLDDYVGKEIAQKIIDGTGKSEMWMDGMGKRTEWKTMQGLDLKVGGEGMKAFYNQIVPKVAKEILRKTGGGELRQFGIPNSQRDNGPIMGMMVMDWMGIPSDEQSAYWRNMSEAEREEKSEAYRNRKGGAVLQQLGFDMTPALKDAAGAGLPMFSRKPESEPGNQTDTARSEAFQGKVRNYIADLS